MSSIPGVSTYEKLEIQRKVDKIISKEFLSPCPHFINKVSTLNNHIIQYLSSERTCKKDAKICTNFHHRRYPNNPLEYVTEIKTYLNNPQHIVKLLHKTFNSKELIILLNNLDIFIKNDYVRAYFPVLKKESLEEIYGDKGKKNKSPLLPIVAPYKTKLQVKPEFPEEVKKKINNLFNREKKKIFNEYERRIYSKKKLKKILDDLGMSQGNIRKISDMQVGNHPMVEYYMNEHNKMKKSFSMNSIFHAPNERIYKKKFDENKHFLEYMEKLNGILVEEKEKIESQKEKAKKEGVKVH